MQVVDVASRSGVRWISEAWTLFRAQPQAWIALVALWLLASLVLLVIPLIGPPFMIMAQPAFFAGFVLACRDQEMGKPVQASHLLAGFQASGRTLIQVGSVALLATILIQMALHATGIFDDLPAKEDMRLYIEGMTKAIEKYPFYWGASIFAQSLVNGILWFTAALIAHKPMPASHAIRWSFFALIGNVIPLTIFGVLLITLATIAILPMGLGLVVYLPIYAIVHYTSFKAVFRADAEAAADVTSPDGDKNP
jgi:uncharacterized membrane protein